jgi:hypothetical protein
MAYTPKTVDVSNVVFDGWPQYRDVCFGLPKASVRCIVSYFLKKGSYAHSSNCLEQKSTDWTDAAAEG